MRSVLGLDLSITSSGWFLQEEKKKFVPTRQMITDIFDGKIKDANFWSSLLESYITNPDPIIGPFSYYIKKNPTSC